MGRRSSGAEAGDLAQVAARIVVEEQVVDYAAAKRRAAERLGLSPRSGLPDNARVHAEVLAYQRLFGGTAYVERLRQLRQTAVQALRFLHRFDARLTGAVVTGAICEAHRVQLHAFPDQPERVDVFLEEQGFQVQPDERDYRYGDGRVQTVPLARFEANGIGVDVALFTPGDERRLPLSPLDGRPAPRLTLAQAERLAAQPIETVLEG